MFMRKMSMEQKINPLENTLKIINNSRTSKNK